MSCPIHPLWLRAETWTAVNPAMVRLMLWSEVMVDIERQLVGRNHDVAGLPQQFPALPALGDLEPGPVAIETMAPLERTPERIDSVRAARWWRDLLEGAFDIRAAAPTETRLRARLVACRANEERRATRREKEIVERVITGELQKSVALDLGLAPSTVATDFARVLEKLGLRRPIPTIPLPLVVLAQKALGHVPLAVLEVIEDGDGAMVISAPRVDYRQCSRLTVAERKVAELVAEGLTRKDIARARSTSVHTVANQVSAVLTRLRVTGRFALIRAGLLEACA